MREILVVDDSETLRVQIGAVLKAAGFVMIEAGTGIEGLDRLADHPGIKLVLCDVNMPEMDGITMCRKIHANAAFSKIPILMLTTEANRELKEAGKAAGVTAWMTKPLDPELLTMAIQTVLGAAK